MQEFVNYSPTSQRKETKTVKVTVNELVNFK